jgi:hypothetical protein
MVLARGQGCFADGPGTAHRMLRPISKVRRHPRAAGDQPMAHFGGA